MSTRAPRVWHIAERFGRFYVENQYGGFAGWHTTRETAVTQGRKYVEQDGDTFTDQTWCELVPDGTDTDGTVWERCTVHGFLTCTYVCEGYTAPEYREGDAS